MCIAEKMLIYGLMKRRVFLGAAGATLIAGPALAQRIPLDRLSAYFNTLTMAESAFTQLGDDGSRATGRIYLRRPGRLRFEYDPPNQTLVIASAGTIGIFDPASNVRNAERYPLRRTPLKLILEKNVDLARRSMVVGHDFDGTSTIVTAQDPAEPELGRLQMVFSDAPVRLRQWVVIDGAGSRTTVILDGLEARDSLPFGIFDIDAEEQRRAR